MPAKDKVKVTPSSGNVFRDLGFSKEEAERLRIRADLLNQIQKVATARGLTHAELAKLLGVSQPRVSHLLQGRLHRFSIETLIDMLGRLGVQVRLTVSPARKKTASSRAQQALAQLRRLRRPLPDGFTFSREEANE